MNVSIEIDKNWLAYFPSAQPEPLDQFFSITIANKEMTMITVNFHQPVVTQEGDAISHITFDHAKAIPVNGFMCVSWNVRNGEVLPEYSAFTPGDEERIVYYPAHIIGSVVVGG